MMSQRRPPDWPAAGAVVASALLEDLFEKFTSAMLTYLGFNVTKLTIETKYSNFRGLAVRTLRYGKHTGLRAFRQSRNRFCEPSELDVEPTCAAAEPAARIDPGEKSMGVSFDRIDGVIWYDGKLVPWADANVHVLTHGLHYASAVFEGERAYGGTIFKSKEHSERLKKSAQILDFEIPWSVAEIDAAKQLVIDQNQLPDAYVRPIA